MLIVSKAEKDIIEVDPDVYGVVIKQIGEPAMVAWTPAGGDHTYFSAESMRLQEGATYYCDEARSSMLRGDIRLLRILM